MTFKGSGDLAKTTILSLVLITAATELPNYIEFY